MRAVFWSISEHMLKQEELLETAQLLIYRLERISADSIWARRSSGHRGAMLKWVEDFEKRGQTKEIDADSIDLLTIENLIRTGYEFLENAARERLR
jgi:hypothetical protein